MCLHFSYYLYIYCHALLYRICILEYVYVLTSVPYLLRNHLRASSYFRATAEIDCTEKYLLHFFLRGVKLPAVTPPPAPAVRQGLHTF
jgi:hypothetical protein